MAPTAPKMYNDTEKTANEAAAKSLREAVKRYRSRTKFVYNKTTIIGTSSGLTNCLAYTPGEQSTNWATPTVRTAGATPGRCACSPGGNVRHDVGPCPSPEGTGSSCGYIDTGK